MAPEYQHDLNPSAIPHPLTLIGAAWKFYRKQHVLNLVAFWFFMLPSFLINTIMRLLEPSSPDLSPSPYQGVLPTTTPIISLVLLIVFTVTVITLWGSVCTILVGKRMIQKRSGRSRTSFRATRKEATSFILPLLLTSILRGCFTFFWSFLLIIPGIIYAIRTLFYDILVTEGIAYRAALQQSKKITDGHFWKVSLNLVSLSILLFLPITFLSSILENFLLSYDPRFLPAADILMGGLSAVASILFILSLVLLYGELHQKSGKIYQT